MFELLDQYQVNELHVRYDAASGLKAFIAIHNTDLGPALGGCRFIHYPQESLAIRDVVSLARGMSYKAALADVPQGGGKSVIIKPSGKYDPQALFSEFGHFVESLKGRYITAIDSGTTSKEMDIIHSTTGHVTSTSKAGSPSIHTARGVFEGIRSSVKCKLNRDSLEGLRVAIQGVGNVGYALGRMLAKEGAEVIVSDVDQGRVNLALEHFAVKAVAPDMIVREPCAVFAPCGLSNVINEVTIDQLVCRIIAGSANVQLAHADLGMRLHNKGILYAPDYVINAGGLIYASLTHSDVIQQATTPMSEVGVIQDIIQKKVTQIGSTLSEIFERSARENLATSSIADRMAEEKLNYAHKDAA